MKSLKILILLTFQLLTVASFCQSSIGFFGGYDNSTFYDKDGHHYNANYVTSPNYIIGVLFKEKQNKFLNVSFSLDYLKQSVEIDAIYGGLSYLVTRNLDLDLYSINFRFLPELKFGDKFCVYLNIGPYIGWIVHSYYHNIGSYWVMTDPNNSESWNKYENAKEEFNGADFGISASLGMEIPIAESLKVNLSGNYSYGLNSIADGDIGSNAKINSENLFFTVGLFYSLKNFSLIRTLEEQ